MVLRKRTVNWRERGKMKEKKLELYIHIPFCVQKCLYCDFLSMPAEEGLRRHYIDKLIEEINQKSEQYSSYAVSTIFLGGGTPSILSGRQIAAVMEMLQQKFSIERQAEITIECNPGTLDRQKLSSYKSCGINRISMGLQSAQKEELKDLGRIHTFEEFQHNYDLVRKYGFENVNIDLMSALPGQSLRSWENTLQTICALRSEHISAYSLIIEEGTPFYQKYGEDERRREEGKIPCLLPDEELERAMYVLTQQMLLERGYRQYEISNYARPGKECRHNIGYWTRENYLGLGLGSASLIENVRFSNSRNLEEYLNGDFAPKEWEVLNQRQQMEEFMFLGLRLRDGVSRRRFQEIFGVEFQGVYGNAVKHLSEQKLLEQKEGYILLTEEGISVSNYVMSEFLLEI